MMLFLRLPVTVLLCLSLFSPVTLQSAAQIAPEANSALVDVLLAHIAYQNLPDEQTARLLLKRVLEQNTDKTAQDTANCAEINLVKLCNHLLLMPRRQADQSTGQSAGVFPCIVDRMLRCIAHARSINLSLHQPLRPLEYTPHPNCVPLDYPGLEYHDEKMHTTTGRPLSFTQLQELPKEQRCPLFKQISSAHFAYQFALDRLCAGTPDGHASLLGEVLTTRNTARLITPYVVQFDRTIPTSENITQRRIEAACVSLHKRAPAVAYKLLSDAAQQCGRTDLVRATRSTK